MAATKRNGMRHEEAREKIKTTQLINRLQNHIDAHPETKDLAKKLLSDSQVRATLGLLKKSLPDLQSVELTGDPENPVNMNIGFTVQGVKPKD